MVRELANGVRKKIRLQGGVSEQLKLHLAASGHEWCFQSPSECCRSQCKPAGCCWFFFALSELCVSLRSWSSKIPLKAEPFALNAGGSAAHPGKTPVRAAGSSTGLQGGRIFTRNVTVVEGTMDYLRGTQPARAGSVHPLGKVFPSRRARLNSHFVLVTPQTGKQY